MGVHKSLQSSSKLFPPGFRFHPTDEELVLYYLKGKICRRRLKPDLIAETDVYKWDPDELPGLSKLKTGDRQWFFLSPRDRKYPNGGRSNRATMRGYWKATGKDRTISCSSRSVGLKKTLVYYKGRAPSGERTDWVMHEYTLDEEELKRCPSAQEYYVLYKVYKKSGPGPKNGEQYGAPFKEEEWADECVSFSGLLDPENIVKEADISCIDNNRTNSLPQDQVNDIDEFLKKIADVDSSPAIVYSNTFDQVNIEKENESTLVSHSSWEGSLHDRSMLPHQYPNSDVPAKFDHTQSMSYQLPIESLEVVAPAKSCQQGLVEIFCDDFLEMDDLFGPELSVQNSERALDTPSFHKTDDSAETDLYNDLAMILDGIGDDGPGEISQPYIGDNPVSGMSGVTSLPYINTIENEATNYHVQPFNNEAYMTSSHLWQPEQRCNLFTPESNQAVVSEPTTGVLCNEENANLPTGATQNQSYTVDNGRDSWFSAALWSFIESIPTTPASAAENALVNKAFERMSSFGRLKPIHVAGNPTASTTRRRVQNFMGGMFSFSVIGIVCAILWVLISISMKLFGRYISS